MLFATGGATGLTDSDNGTGTKGFSGHAIYSNTYDSYCIRPAIRLNLSVVADEIAPKLFEVTVGGTTTAYSTVDEAFAAANNAGTATVKMLADAEIAKTLTVAAGNNITLDLNGHKLALKADKIGSVIEVGGTFTLDDDKTNTDYNTTPHTIASPVTDENIRISGGLITGGNKSGIRVNGSAIFTMTGGTVAGNAATSSSGGGVYINDGGAVVMSNGVITQNKADSAGGGVYMYQNSEFTMNGGEITHNQSGNMAGAGVYVYRCAFHLSGNVKITDNAYKIGLASNVHLVNGVIGSSVIYVDGELVDGSIIGVDSSGACITNYKQSDKPSKFFIPDYTNYHCVYVSNKTNGAVTVGSHKGGTATCTQKAVCTNCGERYGEVDGTKHTPDADDGDCTTALTCKECSAVITAAYSSHLWSISYRYDDTHHWLKCDREGCTQTAAKFTHAYGIWQTETAATCSSEGSKKHICSVCGHEETEAIAIDEHAHGFGEWTVVRQSTLDAFGEEKRVCSHDGTHIETRQLPKRVPQLVKPDENGGENRVVVTLPDGFAPDVELLVTEISEDNYGNYESVAQTVNGEVGHVYDVILKSNGVSVQPDGLLTIKLRIPQNLMGKNFHVFHLHDGNATDTEYTVDGNYAVVTADKLSEFVFTGEKSTPAAFSPLWLIFIIIVSLVIAGGIGFIVYGKLSKNKTAEDKE